MTLTKELIKQNEEFDIKDRMIDERRNWYIDYQRDHNGKLPKSMKEFAERFDVEIPDPNKLAEDEAKGGKKKDKGDKKPKEKKEKGKGKKGEKKEPKKEYIWTGATTDVVVLLQEKTDKFVNVWEKKDETDKAFNKFDTEMIKEEVKPKVEKEIEKVVDKMMEMELENLELLMGKKGKKKKKKKAKKTKKKKAKKMPPALKLIAKKTTYELLNELFVLGIAKKINKPHRIVDFQGEYNFIGSVMEDKKEPVPDSSLAQVRNSVVEWGILPIGSKAIHENTVRNGGGIKSMLFLGPQGTGKTKLAKTIAYETSSLFLDISPAIIENTYPEKKGEDKLVATVMRVAKELQPAVIYIDECEMVFPAKKKKKKGKKEKKGKGPSRIKLQLNKLKKAYLKKTDRVLIIGCTNCVGEMSAPDATKFFDVHLYFPFPDVLNRKYLWEYFIKSFGGEINPEFAISTLAHITHGYSAGSIRHSCEKVLTEQRKKWVISTYMIQK